MYVSVFLSLYERALLWLVGPKSAVGVATGELCCVHSSESLLWSTAAEGKAYRAVLSKHSCASEGYSNTEEEILFPLARY